MPREHPAPRPKAKPKKKKSMPATQPTPAQGTRRRRKEILPRVSAAVSIDEDLYLRAIDRARAAHGNNFSGYVRALITGDLRRTV